MQMYSKIASPLQAKNLSCSLASKDKQHQLKYYLYLHVTISYVMHKKWHRAHIYSLEKHRNTTVRNGTIENESP